jgi:hypothetical protein
MISNYLKISLGIFVMLAISRLAPHPPNFTSLLALSFYVPIFFGIKFLPALILSFIFTDLLIGLHNVTFFTWGSVIMIGFISKYFSTTIVKRIFGAFIGACIFFLITNFGVWSSGYYGYTLNGLVICYYMALPFFAYSIISTFVFSGIFETIYKFKTNIKNKLFNLNFIK